MKDWAFDLPQRRRRELFCSHEDIQTLYLGDKKNTPVVVYDKARQLKLPPEMERTRVECRLRNAGTVSGLGSLPDPFKGVQVFDPRRPAMPFGEQTRMAALMVGQDRGQRGILKLFPKPAHQTVLAALVKCAAPWWNPNPVWSGWNGILAATLPGLLPTVGPVKKMLVQASAD
jgi:hypothetical protein